MNQHNFSEQEKFRQVHLTGEPPPRTEVLLCASHCTKNFIFVLSLNSQNPCESGIMLIMWRKLHKGMRWFSRKDTLKKQNETKNLGVLVDHKFKLATVLLKSYVHIKLH